MSRNILILGTTNSARSIMAEAYINTIARGEWQAFSAGSRACGIVNQHAIATLSSAGFSGEGLRSKLWREFTREGAPLLDVVVTVCDEAANENEPDWPGCPRQLHWMLPDPEAHAMTPEERAATFRAVFGLVRTRVDSFLAEESGTGLWVPPKALRRASVRR